MSFSRDRQVRRLRALLKTGKSLKAAAMRADMDEKTARKYREGEKLPSEIGVWPRTWRTREDPFAEVWDEVCEQLEISPGLQAKTLFLWLQRKYPGRFEDGQVRTLQRRLRQWRATAGPAKEVFFAQIHHPGRLAASDFTHMRSPGRDARRPALRPHGLPFRPDLLELGDRLDLLLGKLREPQ